MGRLSSVAEKLISPSQTAFIKGRYIYDGAVMLHEVIHELKQKKMQGVLLKIDFEKAHDSIRWDFVEKVLQRKGFDDRLIRWIMSTVRGGVCININGENGGYFRTHRGLRQDDPLSPLFFQHGCRFIGTSVGQSKRAWIHKGGSTTLDQWGPDSPAVC